MHHFGSKDTEGIQLKCIPEERDTIEKSYTHNW